MRRRPLRDAITLTALLVAATAGACDGGGAPADRGAPSREGTPPTVGGTRVVSLVPSATETILALGAGDALVARTDFDTASALQRLPSVGGGLHPSREALLSLRPDLVVTFEAASDPETPAFLDRIGVAHLSVRPESVAEVREMIRALGDALGRRASADSLDRALGAELQRVRDRVAGHPPVRAAYLLGGTPPWVAGPGSLPADLIRLAGGVNVFDDVGRRYAPVDPETLVGRDIDVLLAGPGTRLDPRLREGLLVRRVSPAVELPGPRLAEAARSVAEALHGAGAPDAGG